MKLNNTIILTLNDFRRHFNFPAFWNSRKCFVRDMDPEIVPFYTQEEKNNFYRISLWIKAEQTQNDTEAVRQAGLTALSEFAKCNVTEKDLKKVIGMLDYTASIIYAPCNGTLNLPGKFMPEMDAKEFAKSVNEKEQIHKIEIDGEGLRVASIYIDGKEMYVLKNDECIYATEVKGSFLRLLPNSDKRSAISLHLENQPGEFESTLIESISSFGKITKPHPCVTQFCFSEDDKPLWSKSKYVEF